MLYNEDLKNEYMEFATATNDFVRNQLTPHFEVIGEFEKRLGKDCSCFTTSEIESYYKWIMTPSNNFLYNINSMLRQYTNYCINRNLVPDCQNHYDEFTSNKLLDCININSLDKSIITQEEMLEAVRDLKNPSDGFMLFALFLGICGKKKKELIDAEPSQFDKENLVMHTSQGRDIPVSIEFINKAISAANEYDYTTMGGDRDCFGFDKSDPRCIKRLYNAKSEDDTVVAHRTFMKFQRLRKYAGLEEITMKSVMESGRIHLIKTMMERDNTDIMSTLSNNRKEIEFRYGKIASMELWVAKYERYF